MSFLGIKIKPLQLLGKIAKKAAPIASFINPLLGAGLAAGGAVLEKGKKVKLLKDIVAPAALNFGAGKLLGGKGGGSILDKAKAAFTGGGSVPAGEGAIGGGGGGILSTVGGYIKKNPLDAARLGLAGISAVKGAKTSAAGERAVNDALSSFPEAGHRIDLGDVFADPANPYAAHPGVPAINTAQRAARAALGR